MSPILDSIGSVKAYGWGALLSLTAFESISTISGSSTSVSFNSIPQNYQNLQIRAFLRDADSGSNTANALRVSFNNNSSSVYNTYNGDANGSSLTTNNFESTFIACHGASAGSLVSADRYGFIIIDINDYTSTTRNKTLQYIASADFNGSGSVSAGGGVARITNAITTISLSLGANFGYSRIALYGIKGVS